ncbi:hypothetical protein Pmar_PMAR010684, partial [Perkinsus marinus ATCC 50983]
VVIVVTTHLDAGHDPDVKLAQLKVVVDVVAFLEKECSSRGLHVAAAAMTGDWNIDGTGRDHGARAKALSSTSRTVCTTSRSSDEEEEEGSPVGVNQNSGVYGRVQSFLAKSGFQDVWQMHAEKESLPRAPSYEGDWGELSEESLVKYGVTSDQDVPSCPKRLDYLWVKSGAEDATSESRPPAESSLSSISASSSRSRSQEVMMVTIAPAQLWRADVPLRSACAKAMLSGDKREERGLRRQINSHNTNRTSDHASLVGRIRLSRMAGPVSPASNQQAKDDLKLTAREAGSSQLADVDSSEIVVNVGN